MAEKHVYDVIVIGGGPAGLTAALYTGRGSLDTFVIAGAQAGGQLMLTSDVENYPGFPEGILGPELIRVMREQAARFGPKFIDQDVTTVDFSRRPFKLMVGEDEYQGRTVIVATGASARWIGLESETRLRGRGVSSCATCDGFFFRGQELVVVGGGDSAMEETLFLTRYATKLTLIHRRDKLRASKIMQERAFAHPKIEFFWNGEVEEVLGDNSVEGVIVRNNKTDERTRLDCKGVFVAIGHEPNTSFLKGHIALDEKGYAVVTEHTRSSVEGVFVAGDVFDHRYRQAVTAAGSGCEAAMDAIKYLEEQGLG